MKTSYSPISGRRKGGLNSTILHNWWAEAVYCILVVASLLAIVATVYPYDGHPMPQWPYRLSINTLIAIFTTILKATMLIITAEGLSQLKWVWFSRPRPLQDLTRYDMASRGPWGALRLLWTLRGRDVVSSIGAFATVAALVIDPFTQQVVQAYTCAIADPKIQASIPRTNVYSEIGEHIGAALTTLYPGMQSAIYAGVYNPEMITIPFECGSGNCTFVDHYSSIGYCSSCVDLTPSLKVTVTTGRSLVGGETFAFPVYNTTLPSGLSCVYSANCVGTCYGDVENQTLFVMTTDTSGSVQMILGDTSPLDNWLKDCTNTESGGQLNDSWTCAQPGYGAAQCDLYPCVRRYKASVVGNKLTEHVVSTSSLNDWSMASMGSTSMFSLVDVDCLSDQERQLLLHQGYHITDGAATTTWLPYNASFDPFSGTPSQIYGPNDTPVSRNCIYEFYWQSDNDVAYFLQQNFNASIVTEGDIFGGPSIAQAFYDAGNVNFASVQATFANIAQSMTVYIRTTGNASYSAPALGQAITQDTCVRVQWAWLTYPAAIVLLVVMFFATMIWVTGAGGDAHVIHGWRSSPLVLMYHGLDPSAQHRHGYGMLVRNEDMEQDARRIRVKLQPSEKGWLFSEDDLN